MDDIGQGKSPSARTDLSRSGNDRAAQDDGLSRGLSDHTQKRIGLHLRAMYDTIVQQPVPDRFRDLIDKLDASGKQA